MKKKIAIGLVLLVAVTGIILAQSRCGSCNGVGKVKCGTCSSYTAGPGRITCQRCGGRGYTSYNTFTGEKTECSSCNGRGSKTCYECGGSGKVECTTCNGVGSIW